MGTEKGKIPVSYSHTSLKFQQVALAYFIKKHYLCIIISRIDVLPRAGIGLFLFLQLRAKLNKKRNKPKHKTTENQQSKTKHYVKEQIKNCQMGVRDRAV